MSCCPCSSDLNCNSDSSPPDSLSGTDISGASITGATITGSTISSSTIVGLAGPPVNSVAALRALAGASLVPYVQLLGYNNPGDGGGGLMRYDSTSVAADDGGMVFAPNVGSGRWLRVYTGGDIHVLWFAANTTPGTTDMTAAITAAVAACPNPGGRVVLPVGKSLVSGAINVSKKITLAGAGNDLNQVSGTFAGSTIIKKSTVSGNAVLFSGDGSAGIGFLVQGEGGNGGDGIQIAANSVRLTDVTAASMGGVGVRIGTETATNCNCFYLERVCARNNTSHGIYVRSNPTGFIEAVAGTILLPLCFINGGDGIRLDYCGRSSVISAVTEDNLGYGINLTANSVSCKITGGDIDEGNNGGGVGGAMLNSGSNNSFVDCADTGFTDSGTLSFIVNNGQILSHSLSINEYAAQNGLISNLGRQVFLAGDPEVSDTVQVSLFRCDMPVNSASLAGTLFVNYVHAAGGAGDYYCNKAYSIWATTDNAGLQLGNAVEIPEYSRTGLNTSNTTSVTWSAGVLTIKNTNTNSVAGTGMNMTWSFIGHHLRCSNFVLINA